MFSLPYLWGMMIFPLSIYLKTNFQVLCTWYIKMTKALFLPSKSLQPTGVRHKNKGDKSSMEHLRATGMLLGKRTDSALGRLPFHRGST